MSKGNLVRVAALSAAVLAAAPGYTAPPPPSGPPQAQPLPADDSSTSGTTVLGHEVKKLPLMPTTPSLKVGLAGEMSAPPMGPDFAKKPPAPPPKAVEGSA